MEENILLAIVLQVVKLEYILLAVALPLVDAGEYFVGNCLALSEFWRIFCKLLPCN